jgi:hypothetical protein
VALFIRADFPVPHWLPGCIAGIIRCVVVFTMSVHEIFGRRYAWSSAAICKPNLFRTFSAKRLYCLSLCRSRTIAWRIFVRPKSEDRPPDGENRSPAQRCSSWRARTAPCPSTTPRPSKTPQAVTLEKRAAVFALPSATNRLAAHAVVTGWVHHQKKLKT